MIDPVVVTRYFDNVQRDKVSHLVAYGEKMFDGYYLDIISVEKNKDESHFWKRKER